MILKGNQRAGGNQLAIHLLKTEENEHVEVHEVRGFISDAPMDAFKESRYGRVSKALLCRAGENLAPKIREETPKQKTENAKTRINLIASQKPSRTSA